MTRIVRFTVRLLTGLFLLVSQPLYAQTPAAVIAREGATQSGYQGDTYPTPLRAAVYDASGAPVAGASVTFTVPASGASGNFGGSASTTVVTDATGLTPAVVVTANAVAGTYAVSASVAGVTQPARFLLNTYSGGGSAQPQGRITANNLYYEGHKYGFGHTISHYQCSWAELCSPSNWVTSFVSGDFNNDAVNDLVAYNHGHREVSLRFGNTGGGFSGPVNTAVPAPNNEMWDIVAGDFNQDGRLDVALPTGGDFIRIMNGNGNGTFAAGPQIPVPGLSGVVNFLVTGDLNHDGLLDIVTSKMHVLLGTGPGTFAPATAPLTSSMYEVVMADIDQDGHLDVAQATNGNYVLLWRGKGDGTFHAYEVYTIGNQVQRLAIGDFNGDGRPDIAGAIQPVNAWDGYAGAGIILNTGGGPGSRFAAPKQFNGRSRSYLGAIAAGDLNRDGFDDVILSTHSNDIFYGPQPEAYWLLSVGDGSLVNLGQSMNSLQPNEVIIEDFNRDGKPDVALNAFGQGSSGAPYFGPGIFVYLNVGRLTASVLPYYGNPQSFNINTTGGQFNAGVRDAAGNRVPYARLFFNAPTTGPTLTIGGKSSFSQLANLNGDWAWIPTANGELGPYIVTVTSPTTPGNSAIAEYAFTNIPPSPIGGADGPYTTTEDTVLTVSAPGLLANDSDPSGTPLVAQVVQPLPSKGTIAIDADGGFVYTPNANQNGSDTFRYRPWNGTSGPTVTVTVNITAVADPPTAVNRSYNVNEDATLSVAAPGALMGTTDPEGGTFTAQVASMPSNGTLTFNANGSFTYVPAPNFNGSDSFTYTAKDSTGLSSAPATVTIVVAPVYDPPVAVADSYAASEDVALTVAAPGVLANDTYNTGAQVALADGPGHGSVTISPDGSFVYTPAENYHGADGFTYTVIEGEGSVTSTVSIAVAAVNDVPSAGNDAFATIAGAPVGGSLTGNDQDVEGDAFTAELVTPATRGVVTVEPNGNFVYVPAANVVGSDAFTYRVRDSGGASAPATVTIEVTAAPTMTALSLSAVEIALGDPVTLTATTSVIAPGSGSPQGIVTFYNGANIIGAAAVVGGTASITTAALPPGTLALTAAYSGELAFVGSTSSSVTLTVIANTPTGEDVVSTPVDEETGETPMTLQFDEVITPGTTTLDITPTGPPPASGFKFGTPPVYYNLETTAVFNGQVTVCFSYDEGTVGNENRLRLFHFEDGRWTNITTSVDTDANKVCGVTTHFSPFAAGEPNDAPEVTSVGAAVDAAPPRLTVTTTATFADIDADDEHVGVWEWGDGSSSTAVISGSTATGSHVYAAPGNYTIRFMVTDGGSTAMRSTTAQVGDNTAPSITVAASPREIGPPNGKLVPVTISGVIADDVSGVSSATFAVVDEYGQAQPSGAVTLGADGRYAVTVMLPAARNGNDKDGRLFTITVSATDAVGNGGTRSTTAVVVHDQGKR